MKRTPLIAAIMILGLVAAASAEIPQSLNYQGVLTDAGGLAVPDGPYSITFRIYNVSSGGSALWTETNTVQVTKGIFNALLGTLVSLNIPFDEPYWMGIAVEGETELSPRVPLAATAYSLNSRGVAGTSNSFPPAGNVGVGTTTPVNELHVRNDKNEKTTIKIENNDTGPLSAERIIFKDENGEMVGIMAFDDNHSTNPSYLNIYNNRSGGAIHLIAGMQRRLSVANNGNVGVGTAAPKEKLEVYGGGILIGNTSNTNAGTIRWSGNDFQGYNGLTWLSLTDTGGELPAGSSGQTLRHDGASWTATSSLYIDNDGEVGIGTTNPIRQLHIAEDTDGLVGIRIENPNTGSNSVERIDFADENGTITGIACFDEGNPSYPSQMRIFNNRPGGTIQFIAGGAGMTLANGGDVGIGTGIPNATLDVSESTDKDALEVVNSFSGDMGRLVNLERTGVADANNDILQINTAGGSSDDCQFIECARGATTMFRVWGDGDVTAAGAVTGGGADFSEMISVGSEPRSVEPGDVLVIDPVNPRSTVKSSEARSTLVAGIYSTKPGFIGSERILDKHPARDGEEADTYTMEETALELNEIPLAVVGIVPCKVTAENGAIRPGDLLVTSGTPGHAMRDDDPKVGTVVGKALGSLSSGRGVIKVLVTLH